MTAIPWAEIALVGAALAALSAPVVWSWRDSRAQIEVLHGRVSKLKAELADYKVEAARTFVSVQTMADVESRITGSVDKLTERVDRVLERLGEAAVRPRPRS